MRANQKEQKAEVVVANDNGKKVYNVLFLCTGNSARSIIAEAILNRAGQGNFRALSAGSQPKGQAHPSALDLLRKLHYDVSKVRSKSWLEFSQTVAKTRLCFHGLRPRRRGGMPRLAGPADDGTLGRP